MVLKNKSIYLIQISIRKHESFPVLTDCQNIVVFQWSTVSHFKLKGKQENDSSIHYLDPLKNYE